MTFDLISERPLSYLNGIGSLLRHRESGAEILAVQNTDPEMVFGIMLETLPERSNGVAHLLEHLIFRGSKRFPDTNLYVKLVQGTQLTGLNASTRSDSTLFHLSSADQGDIANLICMMLDAVFHPLLREVDFAQERHVVMNEMAGHHAVPSNQILEHLRHELLPNSIYAVNFGGDPQLIAALKHKELLDFHAKHYHPANARLFLWGDFDLAAQLDQLDQLLDGHTKLDKPTLTPTPRLLRPQYTNTTYAAPENGPLMTGFGWAFETETPDLWQAMALALLAEPDGPIRQALRSHGGRTIGPGFSTDTPLGTFEVALVDHSQVAQSALTNAIEQTLVTLVRERSVEKHLSRAVERFEFELRSFGARAVGPTGLRALNMIRGAWRHNADPLAQLDVEARIAKLHEVVATDPQMAARQFGNDLLDNSHRVVLSMRPDPTKYQPRTDPPAPRHAPDPTALGTASALPFVARHHLKFTLPLVAVETEGNVLRLCDLDADLARAEMAISLAGLNAAQTDLVPVLEALLANQPAARGMDITIRCWAGACAGKPDGAWLSISGQSLRARGPQILQHICGILRQPFCAAEAVHGLVNAKKSAVNAQIAAFGHLFCETRLRANGSVAGGLNERLVGTHVLHALDVASAQPVEHLLHTLDSLRHHLIEGAATTLAISGIASPLAQRTVPNKPSTVPATHELPPFKLDSFEKITTESANFTTGQAVNLNNTGPAHVAAHMLETGWLWDSVRVAGGAYSVRCSYAPDDGLMTLISIRDPAPQRTLGSFSQAPLWLRSVAQSDILERCVAAKIGHLTRPVRSDLALSTAVRRHLCGQTDAMRQAELESVQLVDAAAMTDFAQQFEAALTQARTVVLGPTEAACCS